MDRIVKGERKIKTTKGADNMKKGKRKILFLIESLSGGGAEKVLTTLLTHLDYTRFEATLCCVVNEGKYLSALPPQLHYVYLLPDAGTVGHWQRWGYRLKYNLIYHWLPLRWVYRWWLPKGNDVEVAFVEGFATKLLAHSTNRKAHCYAWLHMDFGHNHWTSIVYKSIVEERRAYSHYNKVVAVSRVAASSFERLFQLPCGVVYNPIDSGEITAKATQPIAVRPKQGLRMVSVGRLCPQKAYDRLLRIVARLHREGYALELWLLGEGEMRPQLEAFIRQNGLTDVVTLWGFRANPYQYLAQCDLFVCSSIAEGYSTAVTEALILGLPVVTTRCSGMDELLENGTCGVITSNSEEALYEALKALLDQPEQLAHYRAKAQKRGRDFTLPALMKPIENLLEE